MVRTRRIFTFFLVVALALAGCASPGLQRASTPEEVGFSSDGLRQLSGTLQARVDKGEIPGAVILIARDNKIAWFEAIGFRDREAKAPMTPDSMFRMASMTKPVTSIAVMMLAEEGKLKITDPVSRYLPEFRNLKVGLEKKDGSGNVELIMESAKREMTVEDLLRHTSGITYGIFGKSKVKDMYNAAKPFDPAQSSAEFVTKIARLPLQYQPGTTWDYSMSTDVLARIVEVVSGMQLDRFVLERILTPLRMVDTNYWVEAAKQGRVAEPQAITATGKRPAFPGVTQRPNWIPGGHGLVSTAMDYARFCQMLLNGGTLDGVRIVSRETVDAMRTDHLPPGTPATNAALLQIIAPTPENGQGFGLGFLVRTSEGVAKIPGSIGDYGWAGVYGTYFWVDPKERMFAILMTQVPAVIGRPLRPIMRSHVYKALMN